MLVLYGFLKTGIDNRNIFNFVYMLMKDTELHHIQWFLWAPCREPKVSQSFDITHSFWVKRAQLLPESPSFDMIPNWKNSAAKCTKPHKIGVKY